MSNLSHADCRLHCISSQCRTRREVRETVATVAVGGAVMAASFALLDWAERILFLVFVALVGLPPVLVAGDSFQAWAFFFFFGFIGGALALVVVVIRMILSFFIGEEWSWGVTLFALLISLLYFGPSYILFFAEKANH